MHWFCCRGISADAPVLACPRSNRISSFFELSTDWQSVKEFINAGIEFCCVRQGFKRVATEHAQAANFFRHSYAE